MRSNQALPTQKDDDVEANLSIRSTGLPYPSCAICLDPFQKGEDVCSAQNKLCTHEFHLTCIFPWLLKSQECPCCRRDYLSVEQDAMEPYLRESATQNLSTSLHSI
jgi:Ring finger domain